MAAAEEQTEAFREFTQNLDYAKRLVNGGERLAQLKVGAFDVDDLYRAAWVQAVAALDHWVTREIVDRAVALAENPKAERPSAFNALTVPVELFEQIHHHNQPLSATFREHLEQKFGFTSFQNPDKIKEGFSHISRIDLWKKVAGILNQNRTPADRISANEVRSTLRNIAIRRNRIAHTADRDPQNPAKRAEISATDASFAIDYLMQIAKAISDALGPIIKTNPHDASAEGIDPSEQAASNPAGHLPAPKTHSRWNEEDLFQQISKTCTPSATNLLIAVYQQAQRHSSFSGFYFGEGKKPSVTAWFNVGEDESAAVWSIYTDENKSVLAVNFQWMRDRRALAKRLAPLAETLSALPELHDLPRDLVAKDYRRRPSLGATILSAPHAKETFLKAFENLLSERKRRPF
ncbi:hypothetical protein AB0L00_11015 [Actinoallomurus sp. NPDC052308]|uniref:hypothetical protein n=1 Tax=Actinoallomurus sp. NPDC052308 TaxID=3155530 RepID=UPI0034353BB3